MMTIKNTYVVALHLHHANFDILGNEFTVNGDRFILHNDPRVNYNDGVENLNFDVVISDGIKNNDTFLSFVPSQKIVYVPRHEKYKQLILIQECVARLRTAEKCSFVSFDSPRFWTDVQSFLPDASTQVILKPFFGARGLGQIYVDTSKVDLSKFFFELSQQDKETFNQEAFENRWEGRVLFLKGQERYPGESIEHVFSNQFLITRYIDDVEKEYRIITDHRAEPVLVQERTRIGTQIKQATGVFSGAQQAPLLELKNILDTEAQNDFRRLCTRAIGALQAIDLYVRKTGQWGIFEHSPEFGYLDIPRDCIRDIYREFIQEAVYNS